jgi:predicted nucleotide-binding protein
MARRSTRETPKRVAELTPQQMRLGIDRLTKLIDRVRQFDPKSVTEQHNIPHVIQLSAAIDEGIVRTFGADTLDYERYHNAGYFNNGPFNYAYPVAITEVHQSLERSKQQNIGLLEQAVETLQQRLSEADHIPGERPAAAESARSRKIFIIHGHAGAEQTVARFLTRLDFEPIILHEQANQGRTIIEKFEAHSDVGFAVVLLTADDVGGVKGGAPNPRARQNVVLELGYFIGKLGRNHVCALKQGDVELPSDILGVVWEELDPHGAWQIKLAKELEAANYEFDLNKAMRG